MSASQTEEITTMDSTAVLNFIAGAIEQRLKRFGPMARIRVDTRSGYVSYHRTDVAKAYSLWEVEQLPLHAIRICEDIYDDGEPLFGPTTARA